VKAISIADAPAHLPVRGTQLLVEHLGEVFRRPSLLGIELGWRWLFGIPFLLVFWNQCQQILAAFPLDSSGFESVSLQNPWISSVKLGQVFWYYQPHVLPVLRWLLPAAALAWVVFSGLGRNWLLMRLSRQNSEAAVHTVPFRPLTVIVLQGGWLILLGLTYWGWFRAMLWTAATHISETGGPDLVGYSIWAIFFSLGFFTAFALLSWPFSIAAFVALLERRSVFSALGQSLRLGRAFTSKLAEINLVMGIVKLALLVLAMVFSSAPVPFADELGSEVLHVALGGAAIIYVVANDFFQVVRLKAFLEFWQLFRANQARPSTAN
jgi:hypothetical protein